MSIEYDLYLNEHKMNTMRAFDWLCKNVFIYSYFMNSSVLKASRNIVKHDESKYSIEEYQPYDEHFYGDHPEFWEDEFNLAWLHHIHHNPHHWQHWVLVNDDPKLGTIGLEIPYEYVIEMVCDWWSFSWKTGNLYEIFNWYEKNKYHMILHEKTRKQVEDILEEIKAKLEATE